MEGIFLVFRAPSLYLYIEGGKNMVFKRKVNLNFATCPGLFLFGPRQTGKSYWLRKKFPQALYYDLLRSDLFLPLSRAPHRYREFLKKLWKNEFISN